MSWRAGTFRPHDRDEKDIPSHANPFELHRPSPTLQFDSHAPDLRQCIHKLWVNLAVGQERGCVRSTSRSRFGVRASHQYCCDWLSAQSRSTGNLWIH